MPKGQTAGLTDREQLETKIAATVQWEFGHGLCDALAEFDLSVAEQDRLRRLIRTHGNNIIRVTKAHLDHYSVVRRVDKDNPNLNRVVKTALSEG